jgi:hypothetical protein
LDKSGTEYEKLQAAHPGHFAMQRIAQLSDIYRRGSIPALRLVGQYQHSGLKPFDHPKHWLCGAGLTIPSVPLRNAEDGGKRNADV